MVCCCLPCFHKLQERWDPVPGSGPFTLVITELFRWLAIMVPLFLSIWNYGYQVDGVEIDTKFWVITACSLVGVSLLVYLPLKVIGLRYRIKHNRLRDYRWRPSILVYLLICALPCLCINLAAILKIRGSGSGDLNILDPQTTTILQIVVFGLAVTEWMSKLREEHLTFGLITAMSLDFFFAYDCIQFIMMSTYDPDVFLSDWLFVSFAFAYLSMFRYIPQQPIEVSNRGSSIGAAVNIVVNLAAVDIPFLVIRIATMVQFGLLVSDLIHPLKNLGMISFGTTQLYIIHTNRKILKDAAVSRRVKPHESMLRQSKVDAWNLEEGDRCIRLTNGQVVCFPERSSSEPAVSQETKTTAETHTATTVTTKPDPPTKPSDDVEMTKPKDDD